MDVEQDVKEPEDLLSIFQGTLTACENNRRPHDLVSEDIEDLVANKYDWSQKQKWQSKLGLPTFAANREQFAAVMQKGLVQATDYFAVTVKPWSPYKEWADAVRQWVKWRLDRCKFGEKFVVASKIAATRGRMYFKPHYAMELSEVLVWPKEVKAEDENGTPLFDEEGNPIVVTNRQEPVWETRAEQNLRVEMVHPRNIWHDPSGRNRFVIERYKMDYGELLKLAQEGDYALSVVEQIEADYESTLDAKEDQERLRFPEGTRERPPSLKEIELYEFWGDLFDNEGQLVDHNVTFTVANRRYIVRSPMKNPYWHGRKPYCWGAPVVEPMSNYDKSFMRDGRDIQKAETEFVNLMLDSAKYAVAGAFSVDISQVVNANDLTQGIYPGLVIKRDGRYSNGTPMVESVRLNSIDPMTPTMLQIIDRQNQQATGITDMMQGMAPVRRTTASESAMRLQSSSSLFDVYARNLEQQLIGELVEQVWALDLQYYDWSDPCAKEIMGDFADRLAQMSDEERYRLIQHFEFKGEGLSVVLAKAQELDKVDMFLSRLGRYPVIAQRANIDFFIQKAVEAMGWDPRQALLPQGQTTPIPGKEGQGIPPQLAQMLNSPQLTQVLSSPQGQMILQQMMGGGQNAQIPQQAPPG